MLDCCEPLEKVKNTGTTFGNVVCLAHCAGAKVEAFRSTQSTIDDFRKYVMACTSSEDCHLITSYHRGVFKQVDIVCTVIFCRFSRSPFLASPSSVDELNGFNIRLVQAIFPLLVVIMLKRIWLSS